MRSSQHFVRAFIIATIIVQAVSQINPAGTQTTGITGCRPQADVIFLLDGSDSISDQEFLDQKQFVRRFVELSDVGPESIRVGLAVVSSRIGDELPLSLNATKTGLLSTLTSISQPQEGSRTDLGLIEMEQLFSTNSRRGVARIGVVITDGRAKYIKATEGEARLVKDAGIFLIAVGVGRLIQFSELEKIASTQSNAFNLDPLDLSTRYLAETVDFQGLESCTGHLLIDKLGFLPDKKSPFVGGNSNVMIEKNGNQMAVTSPDMMNNIKAPSVTSPNDMMNPSASFTVNKANPSVAFSNNEADTLGAKPNNPANSLAAFTNNLNPAFALPNHMMNPSASFTVDKANPSVALSNNVADTLGANSNNPADSLADFTNSLNSAFPLPNHMMNPSASFTVDKANPSVALSNNVADTLGANSNNPADSLADFTNSLNSAFALPNHMMNPSASFTVNKANPSVALSNNMVDTLGANPNNPMDSSAALIDNLNPAFALPNNMMDMSAFLQNAVKAPSDAMRSNFAALSAALSKNSANPSVSLSNNFAVDLSAALHDVNPQPQPLPVPQPAVDIVTTKPQIQTTQATTVANSINNQGKTMPGLVNYFGLKMDPFVNMGRFNPINAMGSRFQPQPTNPPTAPATQAPHPTSTYAPITHPPTTTPPPMPVATMAAHRNVAPNSRFQFQNNGTPPTEAANVMIQNLMSSIIGNARQQVHTPRGDVAPKLFDNTGFSAADRAGVGIRIPGSSVADSLAFIKAEMKPARTVEELTNPIYQMFEVTHSIPTRRTTATVMTTTMSPSQKYEQRTSLLLKEQCSMGQFVNGVAYILKPGSCTEFLKCSKQHGYVNFDVVKCPFETFFDDQQFVCRNHDEQMCWNDPCADNKLMSYRQNGNCRAYWMCQMGKSVPACCPLGTSYVNGFGCTRNVTCSDTCMDFGDLRTVTMNSHCKLLPISGDSKGYFEFVAGVGWVVRTCATGSHFEQAHCSCSSSQGPTAEACEPELYLDFQGGVVDKSKNSLAMGIHNVDLDGGTGAFYGRSNLKLWRFSGMSLGQHVTISFRFRTSVMAQKGKLMHIVSNCCYGCAGEPKPSIDIALIPADNGGVAVFSTTTMEAGEMFLFVPFRDTFTGWNVLEYSYDGLNMNGTVNGKSASKKMLGNIEAKSDPLLVGSCGVENAYDGFLDEFKFYMCNP